MGTILSYVSIWEFLLRYVTIIGTALAIIGCAILLMAKRITYAKRKVDKIDKHDKLYITLVLIGVGLIMLGMIVISFDINAGFYKA